MHTQDSPKNIHIRLPNWLGDIVMAVPLIVAIKKEYPQAHLSLSFREHYRLLLESLNLADELISLPQEKGLNYYKKCRASAPQKPCISILFTNSIRGDLEALLSKASKRCGMLRPGKWRPLLNCAWKLPPSIDETKEHQTEVWRKFLEGSGLISPKPLDKAPLITPKKPPKELLKIGLICGTENTPTKRWPIAHWQELIKQLLIKRNPSKILLLGTKNDLEIGQQISSSTPDKRVESFVGKTNILQFCELIKSLDLLITNDTGGMHLANMLGIPTVTIFGPTNPVRTGPYFDTAKINILPPNSPPTGGLPIKEVQAEMVMKSIDNLGSNSPPMAIASSE